MVAIEPHIPHGTEFVVTAEMNIDRHVGCTVTYENTTSGGMIITWCKAHGSWAYAYPIAHTFHYAGFPDWKR